MIIPVITSVFEYAALSFFETDKPSAEMSQKVTEDLSRASTSVQPSVLCRLSENSRCNVCHDTFEEFYDDGEEEWCLRPTVNHEGINYHPLCLEDYKVTCIKYLENFVVTFYFLLDVVIQKCIKKK